MVPLAARPRRRRAVDDAPVDVPDAPTVRAPWPVAASDALTLAGTTTLLPGPPVAPAPVRPPVPARPARGPRGLVAPPTVPPPSTPPPGPPAPVAAVRRRPIPHGHVPGTPVLGARPVWGPPRPAR
ncbi:hypothetical protein GCM10023200_00740 [Actinomycetospora chlora]|uniref:Uncharacterized protein n=1 Tax=Actinomycetospora chlora TaxID=663608 RepID=A0ABP9A2D4_9PSEU